MKTFAIILGALNIFFGLAKCAIFFSTLEDGTLALGLFQLTIGAVMLIIYSINVD